MAERSAEAQERVRVTLERNPDATTQELQEAAQAVEPSIAELSRRQFNAGYVLPLKRAASAGKKKKARGGQKKAAGRRRQAAGEAAQAAVNVYKAREGMWPEELSAGMFRSGDVPLMPDGWALEYDSEFGVVTLVQAGAEAED